MNKRFTYICIASVAMLSSCGRDPRSTRIISRIVSPDGMREAVYAENVSGGATVGPSEEVYIVAKGASPRLRDRVFSQERVCKLRVRWLNNLALEIGYSARKALVRDLNVKGTLEVHTKWLGSDAANGC